MPAATETEIEIVDELVTWINKLTKAGVSADTAAEIARDFLIIDYEEAHECEDEEYEDEE
jgi:hypothetical protein